MSLKLTVLLLCLSLLNALNLDHLPVFVTEPSESKAAAKWLMIESNLTTFIDEVIRQMLPKVLEFELDISDDCMFDVTRVVLGIRSLRMWAFKFLDSIGKPMGGNLMGTTSSLGSYQECLDVRFPDQEGLETTVGQYCLLDLTLPLPPKPPVVTFKGPIFKNSTFNSEIMEEMKKMAFLMYSGGLRLGLCLPSTCLPNDVKAMAKTGSAMLQMNAEVYSCETKQPLIVDNVQWAVIGAFCAVIFLNVVGSAWDLLHFSKDKIGKIFLSFSALRNGTKVLNTTGHRDLPCIDGIRVFSMTWVVLGHTFTSTEPQMLYGLLFFENSVQRYSFQPILNAVFAVESFYLITAVLVSYNIVRAYDDKQIRSSSYLLIIIRRITRLWPVIFLTMGVFIVLPLLGSGPMWKDTTGMFANGCRKNWWRTALFINNFYGINDMCLPHTWYLAVEFQCFLISLLCLRIFFWSKTCGRILIFALGTSSVLASGLVTYLEGYPPTVTVNIADFQFYLNYVRDFYGSTFVHLAVYAVGLSTGIWLARRGKTTLPKWAVVLGWMLSAAIALALVYSTKPWNSGVVSSPIESVFYSAAARASWAACLSWIIVACTLGYGGPVNAFLSWSALRPFVSMSYAMYLIHVAVIWGFSSSLQILMDASLNTFVWLFFGHLCISSLASFALSVFYELPVYNLIRMILKFITGPQRTNVKPDEESKL